MPTPVGPVPLAAYTTAQLKSESVPSVFAASVGPCYSAVVVETLPDSAEG